MAPQLTEGLPKALIAGDTWRWRRSLAEFSAADGWVLKYELHLADTQTTLRVTAEVDGASWLVRFAPHLSANAHPGRYRWVEFVEKDGDRFTTASGYVAVQAHLAETNAAKMVRVIREAIEEIVAGRTQQSNINSRGKTLLTLESLRAELRHWEAVREQEERPGLGPKVAARFQPPGWFSGPLPFRGLP
jgi:hypothetical protein